MPMAAAKMTGTNAFIMKSGLITPTLAIPIPCFIVWSGKKQKKKKIVVLVFWRKKKLTRQSIEIYLFAIFGKYKHIQTKLTAFAVPYAEPNTTQLHKRFSILVSKKIKKIKKKI